MATSLLIQGQGGAFSSIDNDQLAMSNYDIDGNDDDRSPFTKEQRQDIRKSINTAIEISKDEDDRRIKTLEVKSEQGDVNASKELIANVNTETGY
jgi:cation transport regulator ChaB